MSGAAAETLRSLTVAQMLQARALICSQLHSVCAAPCTHSMSSECLLVALCCVLRTCVSSAVRGMPLPQLCCVLFSAFIVSTSTWCASMLPH